uniref:Ig-like domain-containing protein n=1 Tax=Oreochromis niloticus TaxID=8128 RepID=A0A669BZU8_ORENI
MKRLLHVLSFFLSAGVICEELTALDTQKSSLEQSTVTLSYKYSRQAAPGDYFFWYRQYPGKSPEFLISHSDKGQLTSDPVIRLSVKVNADQTLMTLQISSAAVTDSAVYYCAVRPTVTGNTKTLNISYNNYSDHNSPNPVASRRFILYSR